MDVPTTDANTAFGTKESKEAAGGTEDVGCDMADEIPAGFPEEEGVKVCAEAESATGADDGTPVIAAAGATTGSRIGTEEEGPEDNPEPAGIGHGKGTAGACACPDECAAFRRSSS